MRSPREFLKAVAANSEAARLVCMAVYLLLIITCYTTTKAVRDSLFIIEIGPAQLPLLYVMSAVCMAAISAVYPTALRKIGLFALVQVTSLASVASMLMFWWFVDDKSRVSLYVLYVWVSLFGAITASQAWSLASHVFDAREARRSYAWIGLGGVIGGIAGGSLARFVAPWLGTEMLLPICAVLMGVTIVIIRQLGRNQDWRTREQTEAAGKADSGSAVFSQIRKSPYLSMIVVLLLAGVVVEAFIDFEFKVIAHSSFDSKGWADFVFRNYRVVRGTAGANCADSDHKPSSETFWRWRSHSCVSHNSAGCLCSCGSASGPVGRFHPEAGGWRLKLFRSPVGDGAVVCAYPCAPQSVGQGYGRSPC
jgi:ATP/ADP translocase